jgi:hypothetical protein
MGNLCRLPFFNVRQTADVAKREEAWPPHQSYAPETSSLQFTTTAFSSTGKYNINALFMYTVFIMQAYQISQDLVPRGGIFSASGAALSQEVPAVK